MESRPCYPPIPHRLHAQHAPLSFCTLVPTNQRQKSCCQMNCEVISPCSTPVPPKMLSYIVALKHQLTGGPALGLNSRSWCSEHLRISTIQSPHCIQLLIAEYQPNHLIFVQSRQCSTAYVTLAPNAVSSLVNAFSRMKLYWTNNVHPVRLLGDHS